MEGNEPRRQQAQGGGGGGGGFDLGGLLAGVPPVTRFVAAAGVLLAVLTTFEITSPLNLILNWKLIRLKGEYWRLITCFLYYGELDLVFFWHLHIIVFYCSRLESTFFDGRALDFFYMLMVGMGLILLCNLFGTRASSLQSDALHSFMTYIWAKRNPHAMFQVIAFRVSAPFLPWAMAGLTFLVTGHVRQYCVGMLCGHIYYFFKDVYPLLPVSKGSDIFATPRALTFIASLPVRVFRRFVPA